MNDARLRILVTGGAGYIGSAVVRRLVAAGHEVAVLDLQLAHPDAVAGAPGLQGDVRNATDVTAALRRFAPGAVIHVAGIKSVAESMAEPARYFATNTGGTLTLLQAMVAAGIRSFIFSSSAAVYGSGATSPIVEDSPAEPMNPYGESKLQAERMLPWFEQAHGIRYMALRYFNVAGASADGRFGEALANAVNLIPVALRATLTGEPMSILGDDWPTPDGTAIRDYIHVDDLADGHLAAVEALAAGTASGILNLGTGRGASVREVLTAVERATGRPVPATVTERRPGDSAAVFADVSRAKEMLGWQARRGLDEIVADAWRYASAGARA
ncbi:MAG TPA: UDP-glucose 4-epimerase GalE [Candidatus Limnocylindria bacterium]|nr:UDP-glucose 4-epimerase GalE [Candidatus Limnocylindria bacterium]